MLMPRLGGRVNIFHEKEAAKRPVPVFVRRGPMRDGLHVTCGGGGQRIRAGGL
ncbi:hypothetical protein SDC9_107143 [bioreactor metagenome]|uniref:Uncharacterized protein n=1 Tax=bioreactor metagenome TaxID=1076179 RepID=A0A645B4D2_9ZZZZ